MQRLNRERACPAMRNERSPFTRRTSPSPGRTTVEDTGSFPLSEHQVENDECDDHHDARVFHPCLERPFTHLACDEAGHYSLEHDGMVHQAQYRLNGRGTDTGETCPLRDRPAPDVPCECWMEPSLFFVLLVAYSPNRKPSGIRRINMAFPK